MNVLKSIFGMLNPRYLVRAYLIGLVLSLTMIAMLLNMETGKSPAPTIALFVINLLVFPFAKLVWDQFRDFAMGRTVIFQSLPLHFAGKFFVNLMLLGFAMFIAPLGILYLWLKSRGAGAPQQQ